MAVGRDRGNPHLRAHLAARRPTPPTSSSGRWTPAQPTVGRRVDGAGLFYPPKDGTDVTLEKVDRFDAWGYGHDGRRHRVFVRSEEAFVEMMSGLADCAAAAAERARFDM